VLAAAVVELTSLPPLSYDECCIYVGECDMKNDYCIRYLFMHTVVVAVVELTSLTPFIVSIESNPNPIQLGLYMMTLAVGYSFARTSIDVLILQHT
jgi:hypothetical protein